MNEYLASASTRLRQSAQRLSTRGARWKVVSGTWAVSSERHGGLMPPAGMLSAICPTLAGPSHALWVLRNPYRVLREGSVGRGTKEERILRFAQYTWGVRQGDG